MKLMAVNRYAGENIEECPVVEIIPDSAILKDNKPLFLPDFSESWTMAVALAFRVNRLGKNIGKRFAGRYYDAVTVAMRLIPDDFERLPVRSAVMSSFDNAVVLGDWLPLDCVEKGIKVHVGGQIETVSADAVSVDDVVSTLSRYFTFKIGDVLIPVALTHRFPVAIDTHVSASLNSHEVLDFKIK